MVICPGCSLKLPKTDALINDRYNASGECWQKYCELTGVNLMMNDVNFIHQLSVDAYGAQHSGECTRNITTAFALIGLYLFIERGFTGRQVQQAHMKIANIKKDWPRLEPPKQAGAITVRDVLIAQSDDDRIAILIKWAASVWEQWSHFHDMIRRETDRMI